MRLKECFKVEFTEWLLKSNHHKVGSHVNMGWDFLCSDDEIVKESLTEILKILLREPTADHFWYGYPEHGCKLSYSLPHYDVVPGNALRVDKEKIKVFLRDIKIETILSDTNYTSSVDSFV
jgi:hypothetical protein